MKEIELSWDNISLIAFLTEENLWRVTLETEGDENVLEGFWTPIQMAGVLARLIAPSDTTMYAELEAGWMTAEPSLFG